MEQNIGWVITYAYYLWSLAIITYVCYLWSLAKVGGQVQGGGGFFKYKGGGGVIEILVSSVWLGMG